MATFEFNLYEKGFSRNGKACIETLQENLYMKYYFEAQKYARKL